MHGIGHRWQAWEPVIDLLAKERDVIAVDLPGFGASPPLPRGVPYDLDTVVTVLGEFTEKLGLDRPHVAGNSLGGLFALEAADRGLARSVTALSPAGFFTPRELRFAATVLRASRVGAGVPAPMMRWLARSPRRRNLMFGMIYGRPDLIDIETLIADAAAMRGAVGFAPTLRAGRGITFDGALRDVPATIAWGTRDRLLRTGQAVRAQQSLPHVKFVWLRDCGHVPMADDPKLVAKVLLEGSSAG
jgi:pimeloyl-ACP methyl ester carboxylesterase